MKAAVYTETRSPDVLRHQEVPDPACPAGEFPLAEAAAAHRCIESRAAFGRVLLVP